MENIMKKKTALKLVIALVLITTLLAGCGSNANQGDQGNQAGQDNQGSQSSQDTPIVLRANNYAPAVMPFGQGLERAKEYIERESNGMIIIETYHDGALLSFPDTLSGISQGVADIGIAGPAIIDSAMDLNTIFTLVQKHLPADPNDTTAAVYELIEAVPELQEEMEKYGVRWAGMFAQFGSNIHSRGIKIVTPEDMNGVTFMTAGRVADYFTGMGGNGLNLDPSEVYISLERGIFSVDVIHWAALWGYRTIELFDHHLMFGGEGNGLFYGLMGFLINADTWNSLSPEHQKIIWDGFREGAEHSLELDLRDVTAAYDLARENNHEFTYLTTAEELAPWNEHVDRFHAEWVQRVSGAGYPAQATLDKLIELLEKHS